MSVLCSSRFRRFAVNSFGRFLKKGLRKSGGRNHSGRITVRHRGGGHKRLHRFVDLTRSFIGFVGNVLGFEYDPGRTAPLAFLGSFSRSFPLLVVGGSSRSYSWPSFGIRASWSSVSVDALGGVVTSSFILAVKGLHRWDVVQSFGLDVCSGDIDVSFVRVGNSITFWQVPVGSLVHNVGSTSRGVGKFARASGTYAQLIQKDFGNGKAKVRFPSGCLALLPLGCKCTLGVVAERSDFFGGALVKKAGRSRWLSRRPTVRGVAINPVDHPHGGGEGKTSGGRLSVSPWGRLSKGYKTRRFKRKNVLLVLDLFENYAFGI